MGRPQVEAAWGRPEAEIGAGSVWEYPSRCATLTFSRDGQVSMASVGNDAKPEKLGARCSEYVIAGRLHLGESLAVATEQFPGALKVPEKNPRRFGLHVIENESVLILHFWNDKLHFAAVSGRRLEEEAKPEASSRGE